MLRKVSSFLSIAIMLSLTGCTVGPVDTVWPQPRPLGRDIAVFRPPRDVSSDDRTDLKIEEPDGDITLRQALSLALMKNPELAAFSWEVRAREARTLQAGLLPNPELEFEVAEFGGSGESAEFDAAVLALSLSQTIELGGKRSKRARVAEIEQDIAGWDYEAKRLDVFTETTKTFVSVLAAQERVELSRNSFQLARKVHHAVTERVKSGKVAPLEQSRAEVIVSTSRIDLQRAERELETARKRLSVAWGSNIPLFGEARGAFETVLPGLPSLDELIGQITQSPDMTRWDAEIQLRRAALKVEEAARIPDLSVAAGIERSEETSEDTFLAGVSMSVPLFDRNQGGIAEARYNLSKTEREQRGAAVQIRLALSEAYQALSSAAQDAATLRTDVLPVARQAFDAASEGYELGKFTFLDVMDAQRTLFEVKRRYIDALAAYHEALVDVERLIGEPLQHQGDEKRNTGGKP